MKIKIADYYGVTPPVPDARETVPGNKDWELEINSLEDFIAKHGKSVIVAPPGSYGRDFWFVWVSYDGRFTQR